MKTPLHVVYVCADRGVPIGGRKGASAHVWELTRALAQRGAEVRILAARRADSIDDRSLPVPVIDLGAERACRAMRQTLFSGATTSRQQAVAAEAYGLLLNHPLGRELERLHRRWRIDAIYERYSLWSYGAAAFGRAAHIPYLLEANAPLREEQRRYRTLQNAPAAASLESYLLRTADRVIVPSAELRPYAIRRGARPALVRVVPNAADPALFAHGEVPRGPRTEKVEFVVGFLGTLKPWHGLHDLVRAFRRLHRLFPGYRLSIAGDGPLRMELQKALRHHGLHKVVTFKGEVDHERIPDLLAEMDVGVAPYPRLRGFYFSPLKVFEYMAAGVPVVASNIGQIGEVLEHRKTALLHRPGSVSDMVAHIEELRRRPELAARLARAARRLLCRRFTWRRNADRVLEMIAAAQRRHRLSARSGKRSTALERRRGPR